MKFNTNDYVEYIDSENLIQQGKIIKTTGLFKNKYMIRIPTTVQGPFYSEAKEKIEIVENKKIIGKVTKSNDKQIYRIEGYIKHYKIKNIIFISHTRLSAELFYKDLKNLINLEGYNILFMSNDPKKMDGLLPNETLGIMCGIWYKDKRIRENDYFWSFIDSIKTLPLAEIDH